MAVNTYATLKTAITDHAGDATMSSYADDFIDFAEADFNREIRSYQLTETSTMTTDSSGDATLPTDYLAPVSVQRLGSPNVELEPISVAGANRLSPYGTAGTATFYTISDASTAGATLRTIPPESSIEIELTYREQIPALSTGNTSNWLLDRSPQTYLYMCLKHLYIMRREPQTAAYYGGLAMQEISDLNAQSDEAKYQDAGIQLTRDVV